MPQRSKTHATLPCPGQAKRVRVSYYRAHWRGRHRMSVTRPLTPIKAVAAAGEARIFFNAARRLDGEPASRAVASTAVHRLYGCRFGKLVPVDVVFLHAVAGDGWTVRGINAAFRGPDRKRMKVPDLRRQRTGIRHGIPTEASAVPAAGCASDYGESPRRHMAAEPHRAELASRGCGSSGSAP